MGASALTTVDFGAFPGSTEVTKDVATAGVVAGSRIEAWVQPVATADHSADEHKIENIRAVGEYLSDGNIRITAYVVPFPSTPRGPGYQERAYPSQGQVQQHRLHGLFTIGWVWV
jgi:hypothetical protein